jgi:dipeptidyl-peptidase-4
MKRLLLALALTQCLPAEPLKKPEFLKEYCETRGYLLGRPVKPRFTPDGRLLFLRSPGDSRTQSLYQWKDGKAQLLLSPTQDEKLSPEEKARNERKRQLGTGFTEFFPNPKNRSILLPLAGKLIVLDQKATTLPVQNAIDPKWSPDGTKIAYVKAQDLWLYDLKTGKERRLTSGGSKEITHGIAEFVAQEEMRRLSGYCWSPDSQSIAYEEADHRKVEIWYISDPLHPENPPAQQYYPRPGKANVKARLGILSLKTGKTQWIGLPSEYLAAMQWHKDGGLTVQLQDRLQQKLTLAEIKDGKLQTLQQETSRTWVPLDQDVPKWLDQDHYLWLKPHNDRMALALCNRKTKTVRFLDPKQDYDIDSIVAQHENGILLRVDSTPGNPRLHWVSLDGEAPHDPDLQGIDEAVYKDGKLAVIQQTMDQLPTLKVEDQAVDSQAVAPQLQLHPEFVTVGDYRTLILRPSNFDPKKKYPVILDVYGGPTKIQVAHSKRAWLLDQWLAEQGFIVVAADNHGTPGRGLAWQDAVYGKFDTLPLEDQVKALQQLGAKYPELDLKRVGSWGWSFGGYLSAQAVLQRPDFFKAAVAGAPVTDWSDYDTHYTERYLGTPQDQPHAYERSNLMNQAQKLTRPLLLVHGSADDNVYFRHSLRLSDALFRHGQAYELLVLPGITHSFRPDVTITEQLWTRSVDFFQTNLGHPQ